MDLSLRSKKPFYCLHLWSKLGWPTHRSWKTRLSLIRCSSSLPLRNLQVPEMILRPTRGTPLWTNMNVPVWGGECWVPHTEGSVKVTNIDTSHPSKNVKGPDQTPKARCACKRWCWTKRVSYSYTIGPYSPRLFCGSPMRSISAPNWSPRQMKFIRW